MVSERHTGGLRAFYRHTYSEGEKVFDAGLPRIPPTLGTKLLARGSRAHEPYISTTFGNYCPPRMLCHAIPRKTVL